jgi:hypothetical protein
MLFLLKFIILRWGDALSLDKSFEQQAIQKYNTVLKKTPNHGSALLSLAKVMVNKLKNNKILFWFDFESAEKSLNNLITLTEDKKALGEGYFMLGIFFFVLIIFSFT